MRQKHIEGPDGAAPHNEAAGRLPPVANAVEAGALGGHAGIRGERLQRQEPERRSLAEAEADPWTLRLQDRPAETLAVELLRPVKIADAKRGHADMRFHRRLLVTKGGVNPSCA
jgi:hypothetical protein